MLTALPSAVVPVLVTVTSAAPERHSLVLVEEEVDKSALSRRKVLQARSCAVPVTCELNGHRG
jgi:hypothetical protein